jgi:hypothetical protein
VRRIGDDERRARLGVRHHLDPATRTDDVVAIADDLALLHSTDPVTVHLSVLARMRDPDRAAVDAALYDDRTLVRHHAMRRTLWVGGPEAVRDAHAAATADLHRVQVRLLHRGLAETGIDDPAAWAADADAKILALLRERGPSTARDVGRLLPELTVRIPVGPGGPAASAHTRLLLVLGFAGRVVRARPTGTWINGQYRWTAADTWLPGGIADGRDRHAAAAGLARRYLRAFGPVTRTDLRWWAGWTVATTTRALADVGAVEVALEDGTGHVLPDDVDPAPPAGPWVALLPGLDPTTMGWKQRAFHLDPDLVPQLFDRNGNGGPAVWVDGRMVGGWVQRPDGEIAVRLLAAVDPARRREVDAAAERLRALLGDVRFSVRFPTPVQAALLE